MIKPNQGTLEIANEAMERLRATAFWNWKPDATATAENLSLIIRNLREHGGHLGYQYVAKILERQEQ